ncbi:MAG: hypothetical protein IPK82_08495 [Polyangiaceae bacterium]|nr:hypothetical protein [Polyangiaceae bacterium]
MSRNRFELEVTGPTTCYLKLPGYPDDFKSARCIPLTDLLGNYAGPYVVFDFDASGTLVGIEVVGDDVEPEESGEETKPN